MCVTARCTGHIIRLLVPEILHAHTSSEYLSCEHITTAASHQLAKRPYVGAAPRGLPGGPESALRAQPACLTE